MEYKWSLYCNPTRPVQVKWWITSAQFAANLCEIRILDGMGASCAKLDCQAGICNIYSSMMQEHAALILAWDRRKTVESHELEHCEGEIHEWADQPE